jgi:hypothetical protein
MSRLLTLAEVADRLRVRRTEARALVLGLKGDPIPHLRLTSGPRAPIRVPEDALEAWIQRHMVGDSIAPIRPIREPDWDGWERFLRTRRRKGVSA